MCIGQDGMGLVCKKRAADGLSYLSFTTVAQLSSDERAVLASVREDPDPILPPPPSTPAKASSSSSTIKASIKSWRLRPHRLKRGRLLLQRGPATSGQESDGRKI